MLVAQIVPSLEIRHGGPSVSVPGLAGGLARRGHPVELLSAGKLPVNRPAAPGITMEAFARSFPASLGFSSGLARRIARSEAAVFHAHGAWLRPLHYAHRRARETGSPLVISPRGMFADWAWHHRRPRKALANAYLHPGAFKGAGGWHATSQAEADDIRVRGFTQPICVAPNGVEPPTAESQQAAAARWHELCPQAFGRPTALFYSRFHPKKRVLELIDLWLATAPPEWMLLLVGIPETYSVGNLEGYVHRNLAGDRIKIFDGADEPPPYPAAAVLLLPSHSENFGLVVAEAMAHGLPAVTTDTTPWQALREKDLGWCASWRDYPGAMKAALAEGVNRLRQRGEAARAWAIAEYSWDRVAGQVADFYASLRRG